MKYIGIFILLISIYTTSGLSIVQNQEFIEKYVISQEKLLYKADADYLIITHNSFTSNLQPLVELRDSLGYSVQIIEDTTIYNHYPGDSCIAIKAYITYAYNNWTIPPKYILLVGDAKEFGGTGNFIPSKIFPKFSYPYAGGLTTHCCDNWYVDIIGNDYIPEISIGRLPVENLEELDLLLQKIINYENSDCNVDTLLIVMAGEYVPSLSPLFNTIPDEYYSIKLYGTEISKDSCNNGIINTYNAGCDIVFGYCHGCNPTIPSHTWSGRFLEIDAQIVFSDSDFNSIPVNSISPFVFEFGWLNGYFDYQSGKSFNEAMLFDSSSVAVATCNSSRCVTVIGAKLFYQEILNYLYSHDSTTLGDVVIYAKTQVISSNPHNDYLYGTAVIQTILGDPALRIKKTLVGIEEEVDRLFNYNNISISPNPFHYNTTIYLSNSNYEDNLIIEIYNISGRLVKSFHLSNKTFGSELEPGIYFLRLLDHNGITVSEFKPFKLIKLQ